MKNITFTAQLVFSVSFLMSIKAQALPIMNLSTPTNDVVTVYPDHKDPNQFYIAPTVMLVAKDEKGVPQFSYLEYCEGFFCKTRAIVQTTMTAKPVSESIEEAKKTILKTKASAVFSTLPFASSKVSFVGSLAPLVEFSDCNHGAGQIGTEAQCSFRLNPTGRKTMREAFKRGLTITINYEYSVDGVLHKADGSFQDSKLNFVVAGRIGSEELASFPQLFTGSDGRVIRDIRSEKKESWDYSYEDALEEEYLEDQAQEINEASNLSPKS